MNPPFVPLRAHGVLGVQRQLLQFHGPGDICELPELPEFSVELTDIADRTVNIRSMLVARAISTKRALLIQADINVQRNHFPVSVYFLICCSAALSCLICSGFTAGPACFKRFCRLIPAIIFCRLALPLAASATSPRLARA